MPRVASCFSGDTLRSIFSYPLSFLVLSPEVLVEVDPHVLLMRGFPPQLQVLRVVPLQLDGNCSAEKKLSSDTSNSSADSAYTADSSTTAAAPGMNHHWAVASLGQHLSLFLWLSNPGKN